MKVSSIVLGALAAFAVSKGGDTIPQAYGLDLESIWAQYLPAILGIVTVLINESENIPAWLKKIIQGVLKNKGADISTGNKALELYHKMLELLEELRKDPQASQEQIVNQRLALLAQHEKVVGYSDED